MNEAGPVTLRVSHRCALGALPPVPPDFLNFLTARWRIALGYYGHCLVRAWLLGHCERERSNPGFNVI